MESHGMLMACRQAKRTAQDCTLDMDSTCICIIVGSNQLERPCSGPSQICSSLLPGEHSGH